MSESFNSTQENLTSLESLNPQLKKALQDYCQFFQEDPQKFSSIFDLIAKDSNLQDRSNMEGHLASQGFLFNKDFTKVLLLHHKSLDIWIQPGGHMDPEDTDLVLATQREVLEETGLSECSYLPVDEVNPLMPIRVVVNDIPSNPKKQEGDHTHIDLAYIFKTENEDINIDPTESNQCKWVSFEEFKKNPRFNQIAQRINSITKKD